MITLLFENETHGERRFILENDALEIISGFSWCISGDGRYLVTTVEGKIKYMHRMLVNAKFDEIVDHINTNTFDNRFCNLRITDSIGNTRNRNKKSGGSSSIFKGVVYDKSRDLWVCKIGNSFVKRLPREDHAGLLYNIIAEKIYGSFFCGNKVNLELITNEEITILQKVAENFINKRSIK